MASGAFNMTNLSGLMDDFGTAQTRVGTSLDADGQIQALNVNGVDLLGGQTNAITSDFTPSAYEM